LEDVLGKEGSVRKGELILLILNFSILSIVGISYGWQGRMAGMGDPSGLVEDESDFLIHPAGITKSQGINFYGHYRFNYRDVTDWNYTLTSFDSGGVLQTRWPFMGTGDEQEHDALLGAAFPLGSGRTGLFFQYSGKRGNDDGKENEFYFGDYFYHTYSLESELDAFSLRILYGLPIGDTKLGGEIQLAYRQEENEDFVNEDQQLGSRALNTNYPLGAYFGKWLDLFPFMIPYDSKYWESLFKGSLEAGIGPAKTALTVRGGFIFGGDNHYKYDRIPDIGVTESVDMRGDVKGWTIGGDIWVRHPLSNGLSLPFLLKADYQRKTRDGEGQGINFGSADYRQTRSEFQLEVGGGVDKELVKGTRLAGGIYYGYLWDRSEFFLERLIGASQEFFDNSDYPRQIEHRVILRLSGEKEFSPSFAMRLGMNFFYGWMEEDFKFDYADTGLALTSYEDISMDGSHWGIRATLGSTVRFGRLILEPFVGGGYELLDLDGDGTNNLPITGSLLEMDKTKKEWLIGGGLSFRF
jgi:hypothetical protein